MNDLYYRISVTAAGANYDLSHDLSSLTVEEESGVPDKLTIDLSDPFKVFSHALQEGMEVEVDLGTASDHSIVFRGQIYKVEGNFPRHGTPTLKLLAYDQSMKMGLRKRNRIWTDLSLEQVVRKIAKPYFDEDVYVMLRGNPNFKGNGIRQQDETDLAFLLRLAAQYGCEMFVIVDTHRNILHFLNQQDIMKSEAQVTLYHGRCGVPNGLVSFEATAEVGKIQLPRVYAGTDFEKGSRLEKTTKVVEVGATDDRFGAENLAEFSRQNRVKADALDKLIQAASGVQKSIRKELGGVERVAVAAFTTQAELQKIAENQFSTSLHGMRASGKAVGNHRVHAQATINIADVGGRFSGIWYVSQVCHILNSEGYQIEFECQR